LPYLASVRLFGDSYGLRVSISLGIELPLDTRIGFARFAHGRHAVSNHVAQLDDLRRPGIGFSFHAQPLAALRAFADC
jgi:hypothetical protein